MSLPVTVVVCTRNPGSRIRYTVASVLGDESGVSLVLVDQSDDEDVVRVLGEWASHPRFVRVPCSGRGLALARNVGVRATSTPIVAFTDDDCVATPGWATEIAHPFAEHDRIALVFGTVKPAPFDPALGFLPSYSRATPVLATSIFDKHLVEGIGASMAVRRTAWEHLHGFDEALGAGSAMHSAEETDFVMRALLAGYFVSETTGATVVHAGFRTLAMAPMVLGGYLFGIGASLAKLARLGHWQVLAVAARLALRWTVARPVVDMGRTSHRRARLFGFLKGVATGLVTPVDRRTGHFCPRPADATPVATSRGSLDDVPRSVAIEAIIADRSPATLPAGTSAPTSERVSIVLPNWNGRAFLRQGARIARRAHQPSLRADRRGQRVDRRIAGVHPRFLPGASRGGCPVDREPGQSVIQHGLQPGLPGGVARLEVPGAVLQRRRGDQRHVAPGPRAGDSARRHHRGRAGDDQADHRPVSWRVRDALILSVRTSALRQLVSMPSGSLYVRYKNSVTTSSKTASPKNSKRSLWALTVFLCSFRYERCVKAVKSSSKSLKAPPNLSSASC